MQDGAARPRAASGGASVRGVTTPAAAPALPARFLALDVMRGLTLALMIVVNMSIDENTAYATLHHAAWHGLTLTDLVFPAFLFAVGASMAFTLDRHAARGDAAFYAKVARRTALIFLCGFLLYWFPFFRLDAAGALELRPLAEARIPGVLQRIALCYGAAALIVHAGGVRAALAFIALALPGYWIVLVGFGDLTLTGNAVLRLDRWLLGEKHLYGGNGIVGIVGNGDNLGCGPASGLGQDHPAPGFLALIARGSCSFSQKLSNAAQAGARASQRNNWRASACHASAPGGWAPPANQPAHAIPSSKAPTAPGTRQRRSVASSARPTRPSAASADEDGNTGCHCSQPMPAAKARTAVRMTRD